MSELTTLRYRVPGAAWSLEFDTKALCQLTGFQQSKWWSKEAVGQLYSGDLRGANVRLDTVTKLASRWASRAGVRVDIEAAMKERRAFYPQGLHCVGFWHSHPEDVPEPSADDRALAAEHAEAGKPQFSGLVFVIVGRAPFPDGLAVWVHDGTTMFRAECDRTHADTGRKDAS
jgi:proteasome lid subunit RPN8/RPN11